MRAGGWAQGAGMRPGLGDEQKHSSPAAGRARAQVPRQRRPASAPARAPRSGRRVGRSRRPPGSRAAPGWPRSASLGSSGWVGGWMVGRMGGWRDGRADGWIRGRRGQGTTPASLSSSPPESNTMTRRRARPSMSAADRPAGPPPARVEGCSGGCGAVAGKLARRRRGGPKGRASASRPPAQTARSPAALQAGSHPRCSSPRAPAPRRPRTAPGAGWARRRRRGPPRPPGC